MMYTADVIDVIDKADSWRDTESVGQMILWSVFTMLFSLTISLYLYMISNPISIYLAHVLVYCVFGYFISNLEYHLHILNMDGVANRNPRVRYGKGWINIPQCSPHVKGKRRRYPRPRQRGRNTLEEPRLTLAGGSQSISGRLC